MRRVLAVAIVLLIAAAPTVQANHDLTGLQRLIGQDLIPAVIEPSFNDTDYVRDFDAVIGVVDAASGEATAYPVKVLVWHEIVNDVVGGRPLAVTYCPLCRSGIVFQRPLSPSGDALVFRVSGYLYRNNLVMYDVQTGSLWPQILGEAINGSWHGTRLQVVTATTESWPEWRAAHPNTKVLARPNPRICFPDGTCIDGGIDYGVDPYEGYYASDRTFQDVVHPDARLPPKALVLGVAVGGAAVAYPFGALEARRVIDDVVGRQPVVVTYHNGSAQALLRGDRSFAWTRNRTMVDAQGHEFDMVTGDGPGASLPNLNGLVAFWFAWKDHHPDTFVYGVDWPRPFDWSLPATVGAGSVVILAFAVGLRHRRASASGRRGPGGPAR